MSPNICLTDSRTKCLSGRGFIADLRITSRWEFVKREHLLMLAILNASALSNTRLSTSELTPKWILKYPKRSVNEFFDIIAIVLTTCASLSKCRWDSQFGPKWWPREKSFDVKSEQSFTLMMIRAPYLRRSRMRSQFGASDELKYSPNGGLRRGPLSSIVMALGSASASKRIWTISILFSTWVQEERRVVIKWHRLASNALPSRRARCGGEDLL